MRIPLRRPDRVGAIPARQGFTLIELLVVIAIIAILAAMLFPVFARARSQARKVTCSSNLKNLALGTTMYVQDHDETFPPRYGSASSGATSWILTIQPYVKNRQIGGCPEMRRGLRPAASVSARRNAAAFARSTGPPTLSRTSPSIATTATSRPAAGTIIRALQG